MKYKDEDSIHQLIGDISYSLGRPSQRDEWIKRLTEEFYDTVASLRQISREEWNGSIRLPGRIFDEIKRVLSVDIATSTSPPSKFAQPLSPSLQRHGVHVPLQNFQQLHENLKQIKERQNNNTVTNPTWNKQTQKEVTEESRTYNKPLPPTPPIKMRSDTQLIPLRTINNNNNITNLPNVTHLNLSPLNNNDKTENNNSLINSNDNNARTPSPFKKNRPFGKYVNVPPINNSNNNNNNNNSPNLDNNDRKNNYDISGIVSPRRGPLIPPRSFFTLK